MDEISFWTYPLVFLSVLIPYLAASLWLGTPRKAATRGGASSLPLFYRVSARFIEAISLALGDAFTEDFPALAKSYRNTVLKSGWNLTETDVLAGQVFGACAGAVCFCFGFFLTSAQASLAVGLGCVGAFLGWVYPLMLVQKRADERQTAIIRAPPSNYNAVLPTVLFRPYTKVSAASVLPNASLKSSILMKSCFSHCGRE